MMERKTKPGQVLEQETVFVENPLLTVDFSAFTDPPPAGMEPILEKYQQEHPASPRQPARKGSFERLDYQTAVYEDGVTYDKYCNVYLPAGYDPADKSRKYNVVYFQHGNTGDPEEFKPEHLKKLLDLLFEQEGVESCILVFTTYYFDVTRDVAERKNTGNVPAGDGNWKGVKANYYREITEDLIPLVESRYNTYLGSADPESVKRARKHRAFSGYSRGCVCTFTMFHDAFEYFRYFIPMSGFTTAGRNIYDFMEKPSPDEELAAYLTAPIRAHPELPFYLYAFNGGAETDIPQMAGLIRLLCQQKEFSFGKGPRDNLYYCESGYFHGDFFAPQYFFNALPLFFGGEDK